MSKKEFLLDQLAVCRNIESWIKPLSTALEGLKVEDAIWKQNETAHSIVEIVNHLYFYNERWLNRFKGEIPTEVVKRNADTFFEIKQITEDHWQELVQKIDEGLANWQQIIEESTEEKLHEQIPTFPEGAIWWEALSNLCTHNTYHIGQIIFIRKLQGSWESKEEE
ncbi:DinB family protein [Bacillus sp. EAC]|uniref:DinB family protein n=1 Tax=Bacillus sp. EAC TaxID=1978338 RepID=UPI000B43EAB5|nr:DinB family protein [Bacillus sp. EAC]